MSEYAELRRRLNQSGLLEKHPFYYLRIATVDLALLAVGLTVLALTDALWIHLLDAAFLAFVFAQIGFIGHDIGHRQVFLSARRHHRFEPIIGLLLGMSQTWWIDKHKRHHNNPNDPALDPDANIPILAFSEGQALEKRGLIRWLVRYQAFLFLPLLLLEGLGLRLASLLYLQNQDARTRFRETSLIALHVGLYGLIVFFFLDVRQAIMFIAVHQALFGLYAGSVFAPNHKGMLVLGSDSNLDFLRRQVLTSRNVRSHPVVDFWYGGLNYQIEHHLFPTMPRCNLRKARPIVMDFCREHGIPYYETGVIVSFKEILQSLHEVSAPLRKPRETGLEAQV